MPLIQAGLDGIELIMTRTRASCIFDEDKEILIRAKQLFALEADKSRSSCKNEPRLKREAVSC